MKTNTVLKNLYGVNDNEIEIFFKGDKKDYIIEYKKKGNEGSNEITEPFSPEMTIVGLKNAYKQVELYAILDIIRKDYLNEELKEAYDYEQIKEEKLPIYLEECKQEFESEKKRLKVVMFYKSTDKDFVVKQNFSNPVNLSMIWEGGHPISHTLRYNDMSFNYHYFYPEDDFGESEEGVNEFKETIKKRLADLSDENFADKILILTNSRVYNEKIREILSEQHVSVDYFYR